jgi:hypothetical protein
MKWLARLYARRIVNVNVNIVLAGLLALPPVILVVYLAQKLGLSRDHTFSVGSFHLYTIGVITLVADLIFDFSIYMGLHWLANHHPWRHKYLGPADKLLDTAEHLVLEPAHKGMSFIHDAGLVQFERAVLSPVLYAVWIGLQSLFIHRGFSAESATAIGCICGIGMARVLHTFWMIFYERRDRERRKTRAAAAAKAGQTTPKSMSMVR